MKRLVCSMILTAIAFTASSPVWADELGKSVEGKPVRIGVYDSRAITYAYFWTPEVQKKNKAEYEAAMAAQKSGDKENAEKLATKMKERQKKMHRQVFSTEPADEALAALKDRQPELLKKANVAEFVSKWDEKTLEKYKSAEKTDVTDLLAAEFNPGEKQKKTIAELVKVKPVSAKEAESCK